MSSTERTSELVALVQESYGTLKERCAQLQQPLPSLDQGLPMALMGDGEANKAIAAILDAAEELQCLLRGPLQHLTYPLHTSSVGLHAISTFGLYKTIPLQGDEGRTYEEIAQASLLDVSLVKRFFRQAMSRFVFREQPKGTVRHTASSRLLSQSHEMRQYIAMVETEMRPASCQVVPALQKWPDASDPTHSGFQLAHRTDRHMFEFLTLHPERMKHFGDAMTWFSKSPAMQVEHLVSGYPWAELGAGKVVDIGGSFGTASVAVADEFTDLAFIVQDLAHVVRQGREEVKHPRISFQEQDFFHPQSVNAADVYLLRMILHDWSDEFAAKILKNIAGAMGPGSKILIMEKILPESGSVGVCLEQVMRGFDLAMLEISNGRERDVDDFKALLAQADPRLAISRVLMPPGSQMGLIEVRLG